MTRAKVTLRELTPEERQALEQLASSRTAQARLVERARILLAIADGRRPSQVARDLGVSRPTVYTWIRRFNERGLGGLEDRPRAGPAADLHRRAARRGHRRGADRPEGPGPALRLLDARPPAGLPQRAEGHPDQAEPHRRDPRRTRGCGGGSRRPGSASGSIPTSPKKGGHRAALHRRRRRARSSSASTRWGRSRPRASRASNPSAPSPEPDAEGQPPRRAGQAGDRLRAPRQGLHLRRLPPGDRRGADPPLRQPQRGELGRLPRAGRGVGPGRGRAGLRDRRQPAGPPGDRRAAVPPGASAVGVRLPAEVRGVPEPDRAVVEGAASRWR